MYQRIRPLDMDNQTYRNLKANGRRASKELASGETPSNFYMAQLLKLEALRLEAHIRNN